MRRVRVFNIDNRKEMIGVGKFHTWGNKVVECFGDIASQTVAIVEMTDGSVKEVYPECIEFIDEDAAPEKIACYTFEHNDGDQIWTDSTTFYKNPDWTYKKVFCSGWDGKESETTVSLDDIKNELDNVKGKIVVYKINNYRGGYKIHQDLA